MSIVLLPPPPPLSSSASIVFHSQNCIPQLVLLFTILFKTAVSLHRLNTPVVLHDLSPISQDHVTICLRGSI
ncbi:hypothetical protein F4604DRAFT_1936141 [Suillus subluteus]|nr:hypothetical protein F4604DRAFT_1936141 [Suillus subluteus]